MLQEKNEDLFELKNILLMGTSVISGSGKALVLKTGDSTFLRAILAILVTDVPLKMLSLPLS